MTNNTFEQYATKPQSNRIGKQYVDGVNHFFPSAIIDEEWQTDNQVTITVKMTLLVEGVMKWALLRSRRLVNKIRSGNDERSLNGHFAVYHALSMEGEVKSWATVKVLWLGRQ